MDFRVGGGDEEFTPWTALSDISITMVLLLVTLIVMQYLQTHTAEREIQRALHAEQREVADSIMAIGGGQVIVDSVSPERQRITFRDAALFEVCKADLKADGRVLLRRVGTVLQHFQGDLETVSIEGHTDTLPITGRSGCAYPSNWELSSARATSVVSLWSSEAQIGNQKMSAIGRSQFHPVDPSNLSANRRIEVILVYDRQAAAQKRRRNEP